MSVEDFKIVLDKIRQHPIREIKLMGMGEPFMHPKFSEICRLTRETFPKAFIISSTNCQYEFNWNVKRALQYVDLMYLSIDGWGKNYEKDRGGAKWLKLRRFLQKLSEFKDHKCRLAINYTVNPGNVEDIPRVESFLEKFGLHELRLNIVQNWSEDQVGDVDGFTPEQIEELMRYKHLVKGKAEWDFHDCFWVKEGLYLTCSGDIKVCCMNTTSSPIGNLIRDPSVQMAFNREKFQAIKEGCLTDTPSEHCKTCSYKQLTKILPKFL